MSGGGETRALEGAKVGANRERVEMRMLRPSSLSLSLPNVNDDYRCPLITGYKETKKK